MTDTDRLAALLHGWTCGTLRTDEWDVCIRDHRQEAKWLAAAGVTLDPRPAADITDGGAPVIAQPPGAAEMARWMETWGRDQPTLRVPPVVVVKFSRDASPEEVETAREQIASLLPAPDTALDVERRCLRCGDTLPVGYLPPPLLGFIHQTCPAPDTALDDAWAAVDAALPPGWFVTDITHHRTGPGDHRDWYLVAHGPAWPKDTIGVHGDTLLDGLYALRAALEAER